MVTTVYDLVMGLYGVSRGLAGYYPADYGDSGIMTVVVSHRGEVFQRDIGPFEGMGAYDPDDSWTVVEESGE